MYVDEAESIIVCLRQLAYTFAGERTVATTRLLADSTAETPLQTAEPTAPELVMPAAATPMASREGTMELALGEEQPLLDDISLSGLQAPPEPTTDWAERYQAAAAAQSKPAPMPSIFPGE